METRRLKRGDFCIVEVSGRLDAITSPELEKELLGIIGGGDKLLILDLHDLQYMSSAGLRVLISIMKRLKPSGGALRLACLRGVVREVFDVSGFEAVIKTFDSIELALAQPIGQ